VLATRVPSSWLQANAKNLKAVSIPLQNRTRS
jgi:hypothetical protein